ncbi:hypothetical protein N7478_003305 [Penicillium angulare]|uniref:uncharacterized protein n=1 Tax=Penicillium angulare TaxID=116970 RepID=UPI0025416883|nr:uncharacterized protein N7478_003305 [Penicillium angulare]KAJ5287619.1 hypothetical protein N7478_003305 [Penicillium angulare]
MYHISTKTTAEDLKFDVAAPTGWAFAAGDTIIGNLVRSTEIVVPEATVKIDFMGRIWSQITEGHTDNKKTYEDNRDLVDSQETVLYNGPLHLPAGSDERINWEFSVKIPSQLKKNLELDYTTMGSLFSTTSSDHPDPSILPPAFESSGSPGYKSSHTSIKYCLKASLCYRSGKSSKIHEVTWPVKIRYSSPHTAAQSRIQQAQASETKVQSQRLLLGMQNAQLSLHDKTRKLFRSSKVPEFHFKMSASWPMAIRFDHPEPIPITVKFEVLPEKTSTDIKDAPQEIRIDSIKILLCSRTMIRIKSRLSSTSSHSNCHVKSSDLGLNKVLSLLENPMTVSTGEENEPLHLGNAFHLILHEYGMTAGNKRLYPMRPLYPDFLTHGICHTNSLELQVTVNIAGESVTATASSPVKILSAA